MNEQLQNYARKELKKGLALLPEKNQLFFKRMYFHKNLEASIEEVVDKMPAEKLDWAMQQVQNTLNKQAA